MLIKLPITINNKIDIKNFIIKKYENKFLKGYQRMYVGKTGGDKTKKTLAGLSPEMKVKLAKGSIAANEKDPNF